MRWPTFFTEGRDPGWLRKAEKVLGWIAIPNIALLLVTLQALGFLSLMADPAWFGRLALDPSAVRQGEIWRVITFLSLPLSTSPLWMVFALMFLYFIVNAIETAWGEFKTTFYILLSILLTAGFSLLTDYPITQATDFETSLFLAAAALFPEMEIRLYFAIPVKLKWLGWLSLAFVGLRFIQGEFWDRLYLLTIYANYLIFFGPALITSIRQRMRRAAYRRKLGD